jgi:hypothetical protein
METRIAFTAGRPPLFFSCRGRHRERGQPQKRIRQEQKSSWSGKLELNHNRIRRVFRVITAPIFSRRKRTVLPWARAKSVPLKPIRRNASKST